MTLTANAIGYGLAIFYNFSISYRGDPDYEYYKVFAKLIVWTSDFFVFLFVIVQVFHKVKKYLSPNSLESKFLS